MRFTEKLDLREQLQRLRGAGASGKEVLAVFKDVYGDDERLFRGVFAPENGPGPGRWAVDADGNPVRGDAPAYARAVTDWMGTLKRFWQRFNAKQIPAAEIDAALPRGSAAWNELVRKWGAETVPSDQQPRGTRPEDHAPRVNGEAMMRAARAAGKPIRNYSDYRAMKAELENGGEAA